MTFQPGNNTKTALYSSPCLELVRAFYSQVRRQRKSFGLSISFYNSMGGSVEMPVHIRYHCPQIWLFSPYLVVLLYHKLQVIYIVGYDNRVKAFVGESRSERSGNLATVILSNLGIYDLDSRCLFQ